MSSRREVGHDQEKCRELSSKKENYVSIDKEIDLPYKEAEKNVNLETNQVQRIWKPMVNLVKDNATSKNWILSMGSGFI